MKETSVYKVPLGSLISWTNYTHSPPVKHVGILMRTQSGDSMIEVITNGERQQWFGWQCEVIV
jgi:hypothetical protein